MDHPAEPKRQEDEGGDVEPRDKINYGRRKDNIGACERDMPILERAEHRKRRRAHFVR